MIIKDVLYFGADWCEQSEDYYPVVKKACNELGITLHRLDADDNVADIFVYEVKSVPTVLVRNGNHDAITRYINIMQEHELKGKLKALATQGK